MKRMRCFLTFWMVLFFLPACAGVPGESSDRLQERMDRREGIAEHYEERRKIRSNAADRRYDMWWNRAMGKPNDPQAWQQVY